MPSLRAAVIEVSHPDRVVFPDDGITKGEVVEHYGKVAPAMLPHLRGRPLTMIRHPRGIGQKGFFQKAAGKHFPEDLLPRIAVPTGRGPTLHPSVHDADGLRYLANQGTIELHASLSTDPETHRLDRLVLDLDPPSGAVAQVREAARHARALFDELEVTCTPVATGGKGYHLYVALEETAGGRDVSTIVQTVAEVLARRHPELLTTEILKKNRGGRVFLDWMRNWYGATVVLPFSLRARAGAPVAVPVGWDALEDVAPNGVGLRDVEPWLEREDPVLALPAVDPAAFGDRCAALRDELGIELRHYDRFGRERG